LYEFDVVFKPRGAIEAKVLLNFLVINTMMKGSVTTTKWILLVDDSSNLKGSEAGVKRNTLSPLLPSQISLPNIL